MNKVKLRINRLVGALILLATFNTRLSTALAQGSLTPPGAPAPTMKSLDQIEPRTLLTTDNTPGNSSNVFIITQPGSYYLGSNISVTSGNAITIATNDVTLDLMGFTLSSTASPPSGAGLLLNGSHVTVMNGHVQGARTSSAGPGFINGIAIPAFASITNDRVSGISVSSCSQKGIDLLGALGIGSVAESCTVSAVGSDGIRAWVVSHSTASLCGGYGILGRDADNCYGQSSGSLAGVYGNTALNCTGISGAGNGIDAVSATSCWGECSGLFSTGSGVNASTASGCYGYVNQGTGNGVNANIAIGCYGYSSSGNGVNASTASGCYGFAAGGGAGISGTSAANCYGQSISGSGISVNLASGCTGNSTSSPGIFAPFASSCYGASGSSYGISGGIASLCYGYCTNASTAGIIATIAIGCEGFGTPTVSYTYHYNMPP